MEVQFGLGQRRASRKAQLDPSDGQDGGPGGIPGHAGFGKNPADLRLVPGCEQLVQMKVIHFRLPGFSATVIPEIGAPEGDVQTFLPAPNQGAHASIAQWDSRMRPG